MLYKYPDYETRTVICCSTQSGCCAGCRFCGAGDFFVRSLTAEEIANQPIRLLDDTKVNPLEMGRLQIMFMSMGEPLLNFKALTGAMKELHALYPNAALLISTIGPRVDYEQVREISCEIETIGLQFSIHESTDEARNSLIPFKQKLSLGEIATEGEQWYYATGRRPFFNYCVHASNNTEQDAERLLNLFNPAIWECTLSVVCERDETMSVAHKRQRQLVEDFDKLMLGHGYSTRMFDPAGQDDIGGGCGQLWKVQEWARNNADSVRPSVGNQLPILHAECK